MNLTDQLIATELAERINSIIDPAVMPDQAVNSLELLRDLTVLIASRMPTTPPMITLPLVAMITTMFHHPTLISKITTFLVTTLKDERTAK